MSIQERINDPKRCVALGVVPLKPVFFFDDDHGYKWTDFFDHTPYNQYPFDIYTTKHGTHIVAEMANWDQVQFALDLTKKSMPRCDYIRNCRRLRLRIGPKYVEETGEIVSKEPMLRDCNCKGKHIEKRVGRLELYSTFD